MTTPIDMNTASVEDLVRINNIGKVRARAIVDARLNKGTLTLEDLKITGQVGKSQDRSQIQTESIEHVQTMQSQENLYQQIEHLQRELREREHQIRTREHQIRERENVIMEREKEIGEKDQLLQEKTVRLENSEEEVSMLQRSLVVNREKYDGMFEDLQKKVNLREQELNDQYERFDEQKQKIRALEEQERAEREEHLRSRMREMDEREREINESSVEKPKDKKNTVSSPAPPKLATYDGKSEWRPYFTQFNHIAKKYKWNDSDKLDKLIECLRDKALKFYSSRPENVQQDYKLLCQKLKERFDKKDQPHIIRRQLQEIKQNPEETIEEFTERIEELAAEGYPETPEFFKNTITVDAFLRGCTEKRAALVTLDKGPQTLNQAINYMKSSITNQKLIMGPKKDIKSVTFENMKSDDSPSKDISIRMARSPSPPKPSLESRISALEKESRETTRLLKEILRVLPVPDEERQPRPRFQSPKRTYTSTSRSTSRYTSPQRSLNASGPRYASPKRFPSNSPVRSESESECYVCGKMGHFARNC
ncbi:trichohyalin-like [Saccostrea echinata]|uniref:trichohyalin-like n=1 Tax=Saccostrea echinata TaxID=191078 RepID=UPI002A83E28F|nr:trichohyalin-like [Saccostrea echinata]